MVPRLRQLFGQGHSILLVGDYGSGKSEVAVNLALGLAAEGAPRVALADLDLVNPYFRCREARGPLEARGVRVVMPADAHQFADLPILLPEVKGLLQDADTLSLLDVGGDEVGSRVLASLAPFARPSAELWFVSNQSRPFNDTVAGVLATIERVERASGLRVSGLVSNTHLMQETTPEMILDGLRLAEEVGRARGLPLRLVAAMKPLADALEATALPCPLLAMQRLLVPPWIRPETGGPAWPKIGPAPWVRERS